LCQEIRPEEVPAAEWERMKAEMFDILEDDLRGRPFPHQLALLEGRLYPDHLGRRRLFIARKRDEARLEAFLVANPMRNGREWAFELYRKRKSATRGVMPYLMKSVIDLMQEEGVEQVDLCVVPGKGTEKRSHPNESFLVRFGLDMWYRRLDFFMNFQGQSYFKSRFRPRTINRYVCVTPKATVFSIMSFLRTVGAFSVSYRNLARAVWRDLKGKSTPAD
jgi:phosphatidylglycerol lysyltransferase